MPKQRLDVLVSDRKLASTRSQAESWIRLGKVVVNGQPVMKPGAFVDSGADIRLLVSEQYVSRAGLKLESVATKLGVSFRGALVLDVGSSTGGFTDYALRQGARKVYAVDVGTDQLHPSLRGDGRIALFEKTDIRNFHMDDERPDIIVIDVSFISLRDILPYIVQNLSGPETKILAMVKPQFEAGRLQTHKGVIKNDAIRRHILKDFEVWSQEFVSIVNKRDSDISGAKGNKERFYVLTPLSRR